METGPLCRKAEKMMASLTGTSSRISAGIASSLPAWTPCKATSRELGFMMRIPARFSTHRCRARHPSKKSEAPVLSTFPDRISSLRPWPNVPCVLTESPTTCHLRCVKSCPTGALVFGERKEIVEMAKKRVDELKVAYPKAKALNVDEVRVIYIVTDDPKKYHAYAAG